MHHTNFNYQSSARRKSEMSRHAQKRAQQRGLRVEQIPIIKTFGESEHDGKGAVRYVMTDKAMNRLVRALGRNQCIDGLAGAYIVVSADDGAVITVSHRYS